MTIRWTPTALHDLEALHAYIVADNPEAASGTAERILAGVEALKRHPEMGRKGRVARTRELVVTPYLVAYRVKETSLEILGVIHAARRWPSSL